MRAIFFFITIGLYLKSLLVFSIILNFSKLSIQLTIQETTQFSYSKINKDLYDNFTTLKIKFEETFLIQ